jgi:hypothetical protein
MAPVRPARGNLVWSFCHRRIQIRTYRLLSISRGESFRLTRAISLTFVIAIDISRLKCLSGLENALLFTMLFLRCRLGI